MSGSDSSKTRGIWSKLLIWVVVIVAGFFYLRALDEKRMEERQQEVAAQTAAETSAVRSEDKAAVDVTEAASLEATPPPEVDAQRQSPASREGQQVPPAQASAAAQPDVSPVTKPGPADSAPVQGQEREGLAAAPAVEAEAAPQKEASDENRKEEQSPAPDGSPVPAAAEAGPSDPQAPIEFSGAPLAAEPSPAAPTIPLASPESARSFSPVVPRASVVEAEPAAPPSASAAPSSLAQPEPAQASVPTPAEPEPAAPAAAEPEASSPPGEAAEDQRARVMAERRAMQRRYWRQQRQPYRAPRSWPRTGPTGPYGAYYPGSAPQYYRSW